MLKINKNKGIQVYILDMQTKKTTKYNSIREAANAIGSSYTTLMLAEKVFLDKGINRPIKGRFIVKINR